MEPTTELKVTYAHMLRVEQAKLDEQRNQLKANLTFLEDEWNLCHATLQTVEAKKNVGMRINLTDRLLRLHSIIQNYEAQLKMLEQDSIVFNYPNTTA